MAKKKNRERNEMKNERRWEGKKAIGKEMTRTRFRGSECGKRSVKTERYSGVDVDGKKKDDGDRRRAGGGGRGVG